MAPLKCVLASQFWNQEQESPRSLHALVRSLPHEPPPLSLLQASRLARSQQLLLLQRFFPLAFAPSFVSDEGDGLSPRSSCLVLDRVIGAFGGLSWWTTLTGRICAHRILSCRQQESFDTPIARSICNYGRRILDPSMYALGMHSKVLITPRTSLTVNSELDTLACFFTPAHPTSSTHDNPWHARATVRHKLRKHDIILEAACHEKCVDRRARFWNLPWLLSLDLASIVNELGIRYRLGVHHSTTVGSDSARRETMPISCGAVPGTCARAAVSLEKKVDFWKGNEMQHKKKKPYNFFASRPHITLSGIFGSIASMSLGVGHHEQYRMRGTSQPFSDHGLIGSNTSTHLHILADMFASVDFTAQFGFFQRSFLDHTKLGARVDIAEASSFLSAVTHLTGVNFNSQGMLTKKESSFPTLALTWRQQVVGPLRACIDSRFSIDPYSFGQLPQMQELIYGFDCPLESSGAAKLVFWYSTTRKEGMLQIRILET
eukprot:c24110_g1_i2 orf=360-1826(-)